MKEKTDLILDVDKVFEITMGVTKKELSTTHHSKHNYYVRVYAINEAATVYAKESTVTTCTH